MTFECLGKERDLLPVLLVMERQCYLMLSWSRRVNDDDLIELVWNHWMKRMVSMERRDEVLHKEMLYRSQYLLNKHRRKFD